MYYIKYIYSNNNNLRALKPSIQDLKHMLILIIINKQV